MGAAPNVSILRRTALLSHPFLPFGMAVAGICSSNASAAVQSATWTLISRKAMGQQKRDRRGMHLRGSPAARAAYGLVTPHLLAQRCTFTAEESISTRAGGPPAEARVRKTSLQVPLARPTAQSGYSASRMTHSLRGHPPTCHRISGRGKCRRSPGGHHWLPFGNLESQNPQIGNPFYESGA